MTTIDKAKTGQQISLLITGLQGPSADFNDLRYITPARTPEILS
jgi:hypothetical protein